MNLRIRQLMISSSNFNNFVAKMLITSANLAFKLQNAKSQFHSQTEVHLYCNQPSKYLSAQLIKHKALSSTTKIRCTSFKSRKR